MSRAAVVSQGFMRNFCHVRATHHNRNAGGTNRVGHAISASYHSRHCTNANQPYVFATNETNELFLVHWSRIAVDKQHFVLRRSQSLQQEHPQMWHEIVGDPVIGVVEQNPHIKFPDSVVSSTPMGTIKKGQRPGESTKG